MGWIGVTVFGGLIVYLTIRAIADAKEKIAAKKTVSEIVDEKCCCVCGDTKSSVYWFYDFKFLGIIPFAAKWDLRPCAYSLCREHAQERCLIFCKEIGKRGHWGFPGFLFAPWWVCKNILNAKPTPLQTIKCLIYGIVLGWLYVLGSLLVLIIILLLILTAQESLGSSTDCGR